MVCDACGNIEAHRLSYRDGKESCDKCGDTGRFKFSDVYFPSKSGAYFDTNLAHETKAPLGQLVRSREHKAQIMRELGVFERGDKRHGSR